MLAKVALDAVRLGQALRYFRVESRANVEDAPSRGGFDFLRSVGAWRYKAIYPCWWMISGSHR